MHRHGKYFQRGLRDGSFVDGKVFTEIFKKEGQVSIQFINPQKAITPGQSIVFYDDDIVLGGGVIEINNTPRDHL